MERASLIAKDRGQSTIATDAHNAGSIGMMKYDNRVRKRCATWGECNLGRFFCQPELTKKTNSVTVALCSSPPAPVVVACSTARAVECRTALGSTKPTAAPPRPSHPQLSLQTSVCMYARRLADRTEDSFQRSAAAVYRRYILSIFALFAIHSSSAHALEGPTWLHTRNPLSFLQRAAGSGAQSESQTEKQKSPGLKSDSEQALSEFSRNESDVPTGPAPRIDGHPDLSGYWVPSKQDRPVGNIGKDLPVINCPLPQRDRQR